MIAFSAETENLIHNAQQKLVKKGVDAVLANWVSEGKGFDQSQNQLFLVTADQVQDLGSNHKSELAYRVWDALICFSEDSKQY